MVPDKILSITFFPFDIQRQAKLSYQRLSKVQQWKSLQVFLLEKMAKQSGWTYNLTRCFGLKIFYSFKFTYIRTSHNVIWYRIWWKAKSLYKSSPDVLWLLSSPDVLWLLSSNLHTQTSLFKTGGWHHHIYQGHFVSLITLFSAL